MKHRLISSLSGVALLLGTSLSFAADSSVPASSASKAAATSKAAVAPATASSKATASTKAVKSAPAPAKAASGAKVSEQPKLVDINTASKDELKKLPGIDDAKAAKIIAGRPYGSKAQLVSHQAMDEQGYDSIRSLVIAKQPTRNVAKNEAAIAKKNAETQSPKK